MLIDSHAHLEMPDFNKDLEAVIMRARDSGVEYIFTVGTEKKDWPKALRLSETYPFIFAILGVHPHNAKEIDEETYPMLKVLCQNKKVKAYGEIGLDFYRNLSPKDIQLKRFREQIGLAKELKLPIVIHDREAHQETLEILKSERAEACGGIIHCFSGDYEMAKKCIEMGFYISIPGSITFKNASKLIEVVKKIPIESLLIETDSPFLTPEPFRGKRNEPSYVRFIAHKISEIKNISFEKVAQITSENALKIFRVK
jgi:TatD DNase family protein